MIRTRLLYVALIALFASVAPANAQTWVSFGLDRIELRIAAGATGHARLAGALAALPIGARLDAASGVFTWHPGVGFLGAHDLVLGGREVRVVINPRGSNKVGPQTVIDLPVGSLPSTDPVASAFRRKEGLVVAGWAADLDSQVDTIRSGWAPPSTAARGRMWPPCMGRDS